MLGRTAPAFACQAALMLSSIRFHKMTKLIEETHAILGGHMPHLSAILYRRGQMLDVMFYSADLVTAFSQT